MKFLYKLERKFGKYAIPNLTMYLIAMFIIGYVFMFLIQAKVVSAELYYALLLNPKAIMDGEVWRLVSWLMAPPDTSLWFIIFAVLFYNWIGKSLEAAWGDYIYNLYIFSAIILTDLGVMVTYWLGLINDYFSMNAYYLSMSMFLAFAVCYPNREVRLFFILPIKVKYMGIIDGVLILFTFLMSSLGNKIIILMMMLNFLIFFLCTRNYKRYSAKEIKRKKNFKKKVKVAEQRKKSSVYKCAVCGRTEEDSPELEFRYCSKCKGGLAYCNEHLFTHTHVK